MDDRNGLRRFGVGCGGFLLMCFFGLMAMVAGGAWSRRDMYHSGWDFAQLGWLVAMATFAWLAYKGLRALLLALDDGDWAAHRDRQL